MNNEEKTVLSIAVAATATLGVIVGIVKVRRSEKIKRQKIAEWEKTNLLCIENYKNRIINAMQDDSVDVAQFVAMVREEEAFLRIVRNQPMY